MKKKEKILATLEALSPKERAEIIRAYRDYKVEVCYIDPSLFGSRFDHHLEDSISDGDKRKILYSTAKDVISNVITIVKENEAKKLLPFLEKRLPPELLSKLLLHAN